ncbi:hypothetical protein EDB80DRAFT_682954 [Ilyonectria destructans]|nr:hypothetical protein EDB80DRAFT_682954 [Ilyonectria destructans]
MNSLLSDEDKKKLSVDFDKALELGSKVDGKCGFLVDFGVYLLMQLKFTVTLEMPKMKQSDMRTVTTRELTANANERGNVLPDTNKNENKDDFRFINEVLSEVNVEEVGKKIPGNPEVLGKLLVKVMVGELAQEMVEKLVCRKPQQPKGKENFKNRTKEPWLIDEEKVVKADVIREEEVMVIKATVEAVRYNHEQEGTLYITSKLGLHVDFTMVSSKRFVD